MTETDFKVGDKVAILKTNWNGKTGEVIGLDGHIWPVRVRNDETGEDSAFHAHELKLVKPEPKFQVGDWVEITGFSSGWDGTLKQIAKLPEGGSIYYKLSDGGAHFSDKYLKAAEDPSQAAPEAVDGPAHYGGKDNTYEVIKVAEAWGFEKNAYLFNALKYLGRAGKKGNKVEDLKKLVFYVQREIALEEAK